MPIVEVNCVFGLPVRKRLVKEGDVYTYKGKSNPPGGLEPVPVEVEVEAVTTEILRRDTKYPFSAVRQSFMGPVQVRVESQRLRHGAVEELVIPRFSKILTTRFEWLEK